MFSGQECRNRCTKLRNAYPYTLKRKKVGNEKKLKDQMSFLSSYKKPRAAQNSFASQHENIINKNMTNVFETQDEEDGEEDQINRRDQPNDHSLST